MQAGECNLLLLAAEGLWSRTCLHPGVTESLWCPTDPEFMQQTAYNALKCPKPCKTDKDYSIMAVTNSQILQCHGRPEICIPERESTVS